MAMANSNPLNGLFGASNRSSRFPLKYGVIAGFLVLLLFAFSSMHYGGLSWHTTTTSPSVPENSQSETSSQPAQEPDISDHGNSIPPDQDAPSDLDHDESKAGSDAIQNDEGKDGAWNGFPTRPANPDQPSKESNHGPWEPLTMDAIVHDVHVSEGKEMKLMYPLDPFPLAPMEHEINVVGDTPWLAAVICTPWDSLRRLAIRASWMRLYRDLPFDTRFVMSNPGPWYMEMIRKENQTFGDIIVLDELQEDDFTANTVKTFGLWNWLLKKSPKKYQFISKVDTDLWLNARAFWERFLEPRLTNDTETGEMKSTINRTMIGQLYYSEPHKIAFPHGAMYTVTWDVVEMLARLQDEHHVIFGEDIANAQLLLKAKESLTVVNMRGAEKFDYDDRDSRPGMAWALSTTHVEAQNHALYGDEIIAVHKLKPDDLWNKVAACFDAKGVKPMPREPEDPKPNPKMDYHRSQYHRIPEEYWEYKDGTWVCNGVWKLEPGAWPNLNDP